MRGPGIVRNARHQDTWDPKCKIQQNSIPKDTKEINEQSIEDRSLQTKNHMLIQLLITKTITK